MATEQVVYFVTAAALLFLGLGSMALSRNLIKMVMSFQAMVFGANLALFASGLGGNLSLQSQTLVFFSIIVGASVESAGLAIMVAVHRRYGTLDPSKIRKLRH